MVLCPNCKLRNLIKIEKSEHNNIVGYFYCGRIIRISDPAEDEDVMYCKACGRNFTMKKE